MTIYHSDNIRALKRALEVKMNTNLSKLRIGRITGSAAGAVLGMNQWQTPKDVMRAMVRNWHGAQSEFTGNIATEYGQFNEPLAKIAYLGKTGELVEDCSFIVHPQHDWLGATPDGLVGLDTVVEIKCPYRFRNDPSPTFKTALEQPHYYAQMQIEMRCAGRELCHFYQWSPHGDSLEIVRIDESWWDVNYPKLLSFYALFLNELDNPDHLSPLRDPITGENIPALLEEYDQCCADIAQAEARKKELMGAFVLASGGKNADLFGRKLTKVERQGGVDYGKIPELKGVDLDIYRKASSEHWRLS